jgi:hypothetical protein
MREGYAEADGYRFVCGDMPSRGNYVCDQCGELRDPEDCSGMRPDCLSAHLSAGHR